MMATREPAAVADALAAQAGLGPVLGLEPLAGGRNNRVFRLQFAAAAPVVLKIYFRHAQDRRNRLGAEWAFLKYAQERGVSGIPVPICRDESLGAALFSAIDGAPLEIVRPAHIHAAAELIRDINRPPLDVARFAPASEACFSLAEHLATAQSRVDRLANLDPDAPLHEEAASLVTQSLAPNWSRIRDILGQKAKAIGAEMEAPADEIILSPSDFGFHNALISRSGDMFFLDFEYAGLDDPAKLACDFFCQPEYSPPEALRPSFLREAFQSMAPAVEARVAILLDLYRIKWACIVLNEFTAVGAARRQHAEREVDEEISANQLKKARKLIESCST